MGVYGTTNIKKVKKVVVRLNFVINQILGSIENHTEHLMNMYVRTYQRAFIVFIDAVVWFDLQCA